MAPVISGKNLYNNLFNTKLLKKMIPDNPTAAAANLALISTITKDIVNCYYYTTQSYHNKKIPDDKRNFVTSLDLSNGIMNVVVPLLSAPVVKKYSPMLFNKWFGKLFNNNAAERMYETLSKNGVKTTQKAVEHILSNKAFKWANAGFAVISVLVFSQIICKRIITPSVATPLADVFKKQLEKMEARKANKSDTKENVQQNTNNKTNVNNSDVSDNQAIAKNPPIYIIDSTTFDKFDKIITKPVNFKK